jgi:hypothetical protein
MMQDSVEQEAALATGCPRWPRKDVHWSADAASCALRERWVRYDDGATAVPTLVAYQCPEPAWPTHWHLGRRSP